MEGQMPPDDAHGVEEGQLVGVAAGLPTGLVDQPAQGEMRQQQAVDLLLDQIGPAAAQHQPLPGKLTFSSAKVPSLSQRSWYKAASSAAGAAAGSSKVVISR